MIHLPQLRRGVALGALTGLTALCCGLNIPANIPAAHADALPNSPTNPIAKARWANPNLRPGEDTSAYRVEIIKVPHRINVGDALKVTLKITNNSTESISGFKIVPAHADAPKDLATARTVLSQEPGAYPYQAKTISRDDIILPGQSINIDVSVPTAPGVASGFNINKSDFYPVLFALRSLENDALLYTQRFLLNVGAPGSAAGASGGVARDENPSSRNGLQFPTGLTVVYPLTATVDVLGGETGEAPNHPPLILESEQLAQQLRSGGRLDKLLDDFSTYTAASENLAAATCLAIDPQLLSVVERMAGGYTVSQDRPSTVSQKRRLRDSWTDDVEPEVGAPGTGVEDAGKWLNALKKTAQEAKCTVALPWANADLNAVAATGNDWLMREAVRSGAGTLASTLGVTPETNIVIPGSGYVSQQAASGLGWADLSEYTAAGEYPDIAMEWQTDSKQVGAPIPMLPVGVLVADNTVWNVPKVDRFGMLSSGVRSVSYSGSLAASLTEATDDATTVGYSNYNARFDYGLDSVAARRATADAALQMSVVKSGELSDGQQIAPPMLVQFPSGMSDAGEWLATLTSLFDGGSALPLRLRDYVNPTVQQLEQLSTQAQVAPAAGNSTQFGAPFEDPTVISDSEIFRATSLLESIDNLTQLVISDPTIALKPYGFTEPLRWDILRALSHDRRRSMSTYDANVREVQHLLTSDDQVLKELRSSVSLIPPGNVYTRISDSSPLLIVARNGLPLPVDTQIQYWGPAGAKINVPETIFVPAKGSIMVQMTADLPTETARDERTDLNLWLATSGGSRFSDEVTIGVRTRSGVLGSSSGLASLVAVGLSIALLGRLWIRRRKAKA